MAPDRDYRTLTASDRGSPPPPASAVRTEMPWTDLPQSCHGPGPGRVGVIDIGSNTVRLVVYDVPTRVPLPVFNEKAACELGSGLADSGRLNPKGIPRAVQALKRYVLLAKVMDVDHLQLVATAAVREAQDGGAFVAEVEKACGLPVTVLSGADEARLAAIGLLNGVPGADGVVGDLGGGSLDLVSVDLGRIGRFATLPLGHLRLTEESRGDRHRAREILDQRLSSVEWLDAVAGRTVYCVGGSWRALARVFIDQTHHPIRVVDNFSISFFEGRKLAELIASLSDHTLERLAGIDAERRRTLPGAAAALAALVQSCKPREVVFSAYGMREGQMLEMLPANLRHQDALISACEGLAERTGRFAIHGSEILTWMRPLFPDQSEAEQRLMLAACLLSDIGWSEHPDYRGVHAFHRVLRIAYPGLFHSDRAELAVAILIRYGGSEEDRMVSPLRNLIDPVRLARARVIGLALRLAHTISGGAAGMLQRTRLKRADKRLTMALPTDQTLFVSEAVERRFGRLARAMDLKPLITAGRGR